MVTFVDRTLNPQIPWPPSACRTLAEHDLVDEYRRMVSPAVAGTGPRPFAGHTPPADLRFDPVERKVAAALPRHRNAG